MIEAAPAETGLRLRSESADAMPQRFRPAPGEAICVAADPGRFDRLLTEIGAAIAALAGLPVAVSAAGWNCPEWAVGTQTQAAASLAAVLVSIRLGGPPESAAGSGGVAGRRIGERLAATIDELAAAHWPGEQILDGVAMTADLTGRVHGVWVAAPPVAAGGERPASLARALLDQPLRMPVPVSSEMVEVGRLLPFVAGTIWPIAPQPVTPLAFGGHRVATIRIEPTPDGRQQAVVVSVGAARKGERPWAQ